MESDTSINSASDIDESVSFSHVTDVVKRWTLDFLFISLCRHFKEDKFDEFNETLSAFEAMCQGWPLRGTLHDEKMMIIAFLARVLHGKQLDVQFEEDARVMPLMSAAKIWSKLEDTVADDSLFKDITILLLVQSVAVCVEKGQISSASSVLKWFENNHGFPQQNFGVKLSTIVKQRETYHPFFTSFSFSRLLETVQSYLEDFLAMNSSDFLLKAATKVVQSSQSMEGVEDTVKEDSSQSETTESTEDRKKKENTVCLRTKRKLMPTKMTELWKPDSCKKAFVAIRRISESELSRITSQKSVDTTKKNQKSRKAPQKWTPQLDKYLKQGVKEHGQGKWSRILMDYDFEGRTGTMLKDRWRVLMRAYKVS
ncbi:telomeric repeat-binding factor 1 [Chaetodon trifascialis]|uniref:telomeric repeat-binding factor 1 n=1 Tax=Chaetodon trifascialis TaxID=109706 RepID=UPI0039922FC1